MIPFAQATVVNVVHLGIVTPKKSRKKVWNAITFHSGVKESPGVTLQT